MGALLTVVVVAFLAFWLGYLTHALMSVGAR